MQINFTAAFAHCYDPWHRCFRVICFVYVSVCRDWLFITERDWWILKRVTLKGGVTNTWRAQFWRLLSWREELRILLRQQITNGFVVIVCDLFCLSYENSLERRRGLLFMLI